MKRTILTTTVITAMLLGAGCNQDSETAKPVENPAVAPVPIPEAIAPEIPEEPLPPMEESTPAIAPPDNEKKTMKEKGAKVGEEIGEFADAVKDEMKDVKNEVKDFFKEGQDSPQHKLNERLEALDEDLEDLRNTMEDLEEKSTEESKAAWSKLEADHATLVRNMKELKAASNDAVDELAKKIDAQINDLSGALEEFADTIEK